MRRNKLQVDKIEKALNSTFTEKSVPDSKAEGNKTKVVLDNSMLEANQQLKAQAGIIIFPGIIVNNITYRGNLEALEVF